MLDADPPRAGERAEHREGPAAALRRVLLRRAALPGVRPCAPGQDMSKAAEAADWLLQGHERRERFMALPPGIAPATPAEAYAIQEAFVAQRARKRGAAVGYKIALSSAAMRRFVGVDSPQAGLIHESTVRRSPARIRAADYVGLIVEFEIAVEL